MDLLPGLLLLLIVTILVAIYFFFVSFIFGAGYQPTPRRVVEKMLTVAEVGPNDLLFDLGAGTGAIVFAAARRHQARVVGVELEPIRMLILWLRRRVGGPRDRITLRWGNLFSLDYTRATVVALFLWPGAMERLKPLFEQQLPVGSRIVSHWHRVPSWKWESYDPVTHVYLYRWQGRETRPV